MTYTLADFLAVLFNPGESTCFSKDAKGTSVFPVAQAQADALFYSINPLATIDLNPTEPYHDANKPRRADANVIAYRSFLIEMDQISLSEQIELLKTIPYSVLTFSGSKSFHAVIVLDEDLPSRKEYDELVTRIYKAVPGADKANRNPSRLSRLPFAYREEKKSVQELKAVHSRINLADLDYWLNERGAPAMTEAVQTNLYGILDEYVPSQKINRETTDFLMNMNIEEGTWNVRLFKACCSLFACGYPYERVISLCENITGHLDKNDVSTIRSAFRTASGPDSSPRA